MCLSCGTLYNRNTLHSGTVFTVPLFLFSSLYNMVAFGDLKTQTRLFKELP
jgi:hypothetical protein